MRDDDADDTCDPKMRQTGLAWGASVEIHRCLFCLEWHITTSIEFYDFLEMGLKGYSVYKMKL